MTSIMANFLIKLFCALGGGYDHLTENRLFFFEFCDLLLEVVVFFLLIHHAEL